MAVAIPLLAVAGGVSAGMAIAAGAAVTFAGAMAVAGGMAAGLGLLTGDKDFQRLGSVLSAVGGLAGGLSNLAGAAGATEAGASSAGYINQMDAASDAASAASGSGSIGYDIGDIGNYGQVGQAPTPGADLGRVVQPSPGTINPQAAGLGPATQDIAGSLTGSEGGLLTKAYGSAPTVTGALPSSAVSTVPTPNPLAEFAKGITQNDITSMLQRGAEKAGSLMGQAWDGAGNVLNSAGQWVQKNPQAASMVFNAVGNAFGPEAEMMDLRKSLMDRARQNSNSPIRLQYLTPGTTVRP